MNRSQVIRKLRTYCHDNGLSFYFDETEGDGSHGMLYVGQKKTLAKHGEWSKIYLQVVLKQLGIDKNAFR